MGNKASASFVGGGGGGGGGGLGASVMLQSALW